MSHAGGAFAQLQEATSDCDSKKNEQFVLEEVRRMSDFFNTIPSYYLRKSGTEAPGIDGRPVPKFILEMARCFSIEFSSQPVLCSDLFPSIDVLVSAEGDLPCGGPSNLSRIDAQFLETQRLIFRAREALLSSTDWCSARVSFGLIRWWPTAVRSRAYRFLGPFRVAIDCAAVDYPKIDFDLRRLDLEPKEEAAVAC